jgi:hypothetical protein
MPKLHPLRNLLRKLRRKEKNEAAKAGLASMTAMSQGGQDGSSAVSGGGTPASADKQVQAGKRLPAAESQEIAVGPVPKNTPQVASKGMKMRRSL